MGFHDQRLVKKVKVDRKANEIVNRLEKTQREAYPDLAAEKASYETHVSGRRGARRHPVQGGWGRGLGGSRHRERHLERG